jgi:hypothetical protein
MSPCFLHLTIATKDNRMRFLTVFTVLLFLLLPISLAEDSDTRTFIAKRVSVPTGKAILYSHEKVLSEILCKSSPVGELNDLEEIRIGDVIKLGNYSITVGIIQVTEYFKDMVWKGQVFAKAGDCQCVVAESYDKLPYEDDCDALWLQIKTCVFLE